jgi:hypothetical protein
MMLLHVFGALVTLVVCCCMQWAEDSAWISGNGDLVGFEDVLTRARVVRDAAERFDYCVMGIEVSCGTCLEEMYSGG